MSNIDYEKNNSEYEEEEDEEVDPEEFLEIEECLTKFQKLEALEIDPKNPSLHEENLNLKIGSSLETFEKMNLILQEYDVKFYGYFEELRNNFIKILNEIVDNYVYKKSTDISNIKDLKNDYDNLLKENKEIKKKFDKLKEENEKRKDFLPEYNWQAPITDSRVDNKKLIKSGIKKIITEKKEKKKINYGNDLLKWANTKDFNQSLTNLKYKSITSKQLKEIIKELYDSKKNYDVKIRDQKQNMETLEQFMYYHLKYKYGLNNMVIEWVFGIIEGVKNYTSSDAEIALFGLILRNEIDEDFKDVLYQIKDTIKDLLLGVLEQDNSSKNKESLARLLDKKYEGNISFKLALKIIDMMYTEDNPKREEIIIAIKDNFVVKNKKKPRFSKKEKVKDEICYKKFEHIILRSQLLTHFNYLENLRKYFRKFDTMKYGYINREQFVQLIELIDMQGRVDIELLLEKIDPNETDVIIFNQVVVQFQNEEVEREDGELMNLLQICYAL